MKPNKRTRGPIYGSLLTIVLFLLAALYVSAQSPAASEPNVIIPDSLSLSPVSASPTTVADLISFTRIGSVNVNYPRQNYYVPFAPQYDDEIIWSPDGAWVALVVHRGNLKSNSREYKLLLFRASELLDHPREERLVRFATSSPRPAIRKVRWMNNTTLAFLGENPGELPQVYTVDVETRKVMKKTKAPTKIINFDISVKGDSVVYQAASANDPQRLHEYVKRGFTLKEKTSLRQLWAGIYDGADVSDDWGRPDLWRVGKTGQATLLKLGSWISKGTFGYDLYLSPLGDQLLVRTAAKNPSKTWGEYRMQGKQFDYQHASQWILVRMSDGQTRPLMDAPIPPGGLPGVNIYSSPYQGHLLWGPDGKSVLLNNVWLPLIGTSGEERAHRASTQYVAEIDLNSGACSVIGKFEPGTVLVLDWHASDEVVRLERWERRESPDPIDRSYHLDRWIRRDEASYQYAKNQRRKWERLASPDKRPSVEIEQGPNTPPHVMAIDPRSKRASLVFDPNPGFLSRHRFGKTMLIEWTYGEGKKTAAKLYWPPDYVAGKRYPLVVQGHGHNPDVFEPWGNLIERRQAAQPLANAGIFVVQYQELVDGMDQYEWKTYEDSGFPALERLIDTLDKQGLIDPSKVGLSGFSTELGFFLHFMTHSKYPIAAAALGEGVNWSYFDYLATYSTHRETRRNELERLNGGLPWGASRSTWLERAPGFNLDRIQAAIQFEAGTNDDSVVPRIGKAALFELWEQYQGLRMLGKPVELLMLPEATHDDGQPPWSTYTSQQSAVDWFRFWLQGHERTTPTTEVGETKEELAEKYSRWRAMRDRQNSQKSNKPVELAESDRSVRMP
ncbi:MAG TPA: hypothetical protein VGJ48_27350 [Pyrinomonadaceae bacterium]|jgi:dipeptidyl aminopeptidase/acylaminoacyl peptidase